MMVFETQMPSRPGQEKLAGHRVCRPQETLERLRPLLPTMGITRLADITGLDTIGIPVAQAVRPMGRSLSVSQGKGQTIEAALVSAAMESVEVWHAEWADLDMVTASRAEMEAAGHRLVDLSDLVPAADIGAEERASWQNVPIRWTSGRDLASGQSYLVPFEVVHLDVTQPPETNFLPRSSNALAGGNTLDEATASALHEAIERDCMADFAHMDRAAQSKRRIDTDALCDRWSSAAGMIELISQSGLHVELFDMTNDIGVSAVNARIFETPGANASGKVAPGASGAGAHLDPETAIVRAITEAAQSRLTKISGVRDDLQKIRYQAQDLSSFAARLNMMADLAGQRALDFAHDDRSAGSAAEDVERLVAAVCEVGVERVVVVDLTKEEIGVPVVRVIAPGLGRKMNGRFERGTRRTKRKVM